jgi:hypothetical protein
MKASALFLVPLKVNKTTIGRAFAFVLIGGAAFGATKTLEPVIVQSLDPISTPYYWQVAGQFSVSCYEANCSGSLTPPDSGTTMVNGATVRLLTQNGKIVTAECTSKPDVARNVFAALAAGSVAASWSMQATPSRVAAGLAAGSASIQASADYHRDCRRPEPGTHVEAEFIQSNVKLFIQAPSLSGSTGKTTSETYRITNVLQSPGPTKDDSQAALAAAASAAIRAENVRMIAAGQASTIRILTAPAGAEVDLDGNKIGISPMQFVLARHGDRNRSIVLKMEGYATVEKQFLPDGKDIPLGVNLQPDNTPTMLLVGEPSSSLQNTPGLTTAGEKATLNVTSQPPGADITINGTFVGNTPSIVQVGSGDQAISVSKSGYQVWTREMKVTGGQIRVTADLKYLSVFVLPKINRTAGAEGGR